MLRGYVLDRVLAGSYSVVVDPTTGTTVTGDLTVTGAVNFSASGTIYEDDEKAIFGTGSDAAIYYDGSNLIIDPDVVGTGSVVIPNARGVDINPGSDTDADLLTVGVTGTPRLWWDESDDRFTLTHGLDIDSGNLSVAGTLDSGTLTVTGAGTVTGDYTARFGAGTAVAVGQQGPAAEAGIKLGTDLLIYRSSPNTLSLGSGDSLVVPGDLSVSGAIKLAATQPFYLDGGGDTYLSQESTDIIGFRAGGRILYWSGTTNSFYPNASGDQLGLSGNRWALAATTGDFSGAVALAATLSVDDTTDTSSGTTGSIHTDGGLGVAKNLFVGVRAGIGVAASANAGLALEAGTLMIKETTTPTADSGYGKLYTKTDNNPYFQDGAGTEHQIQTGDYAGIEMHDNANATTIYAANIPTLLDDYGVDMPETISNGDYANNRITVGATEEYFVMMSGSGESAAVNKVFDVSAWRVSATTQNISGATQADPCVVTVTGHGLSGGEYVYISGITGMVELNQQIFKVVYVGVDTFSLDALDDTDVDATGYTAYDSGGTIQEVNTTRVVRADHEYVSANKEYSIADGGLKSLTAGEYLMVFVMGQTDATNYLAVHNHLSIHRA